jgi:hypothetical protein
MAGCGLEKVSSAQRVESNSDISPDVLTEETRQGPFIYYRVRIRITGSEFKGDKAIRPRGLYQRLHMALNNYENEL